MWVEMEIREIQRSEQLPTQIVVLEEKEGARRFPIFIGPGEAQALDNAAKGRSAPRPLTHDLVMNVIEGLGADLEAVYVDALRDDVFHGKLALRTSDYQEVQIDTRPSDAMVIAMKKRVPVFVSSEIFEQMNEREDGEAGP